MAYDAARGVSVLFGGFIDTGDISLLHTDLWEWDGNRWRERAPLGALPSGRSDPLLTYDPHRATTVLFGGQVAWPLSDIWAWDGGRLDRSGHSLVVAWPEVMADPETEILSVDTTWHAGGSGAEVEGDCAAIDGAQLFAWTEGTWKPLASHGSDTDEPDALTWSTTDPDEIRQLFFGLPGEETLNFAATPTAPNGCGPEYGQVTTDYVEVTVGYRLPAE